MCIHKHRSRDMRGFTLTEAAIVLGIVGLILGAIWAAASAVYDNMKSKRANEEILQVVQAVRSLFASTNTTGSLNGSILTSIITSGVFPSDMAPVATATSPVNNPWNVGSTTGSAPNGGTVDLFSAQANALGDAFTIVFTNLSQAACIKVFTSNAGAPGLVGAASSGTALATAGTPTVKLNIVNNTIPLATANTLCPNAANTNVAALKFMLKS